MHKQDTIFEELASKGFDEKIFSGQDTIIDKFEFPQSMGSDKVIYSERDSEHYKSEQYRNNNKLIPKFKIMDYNEEIVKQSQNFVSPGKQDEDDIALLVPRHNTNDTLSDYQKSSEKLQPDVADKGSDNNNIAFSLYEKNNNLKVNEVFSKDRQFYNEYIANKYLEQGNEFDQSAENRKLDSFNIKKIRDMVKQNLEIIERSDLIHDMESNKIYDPHNMYESEFGNDIKEIEDVESYIYQDQKQLQDDKDNTNEVDTKYVTFMNSGNSLKMQFLEQTESIVPESNYIAAEDLKLQDNGGSLSNRVQVIVNDDSNRNMEFSQKTDNENLMNNPLNSSLLKSESVDYASEDYLVQKGVPCILLNQVLITYPWKEFQFGLVDEAELNGFEIDVLMAKYDSYYNKHGENLSRVVEEESVCSTGKVTLFNQGFIREKSLETRNSNFKNSSDSTRRISAKHFNHTNSVDQYKGVEYYELTPDHKLNYSKKNSCNTQMSNKNSQENMENKLKMTQSSFDKNALDFCGNENFLMKHPIYENLICIEEKLNEISQLKQKLEVEIKENKFRELDLKLDKEATKFMLNANFYLDEINTEKMNLEKHKINIIEQINQDIEKAHQKKLYESKSDDEDSKLDEYNMNKENGFMQSIYTELPLVSEQDELNDLTKKKKQRSEFFSPSNLAVNPKDFDYNQVCQIFKKSFKDANKGYYSDKQRLKFSVKSKSMVPNLVSKNKESNKHRFQDEAFICDDTGNFQEHTFGDIKKKLVKNDVNQDSPVSDNNEKKYVKSKTEGSYLNRHNIKLAQKSKETPMEDLMNLNAYYKINSKDNDETIENYHESPFDDKVYIREINGDVKLTGTPANNLQKDEGSIQTMKKTIEIDAKLEKSAYNLDDQISAGNEAYMEYFNQNLMKKSEHIIPEKEQVNFFKKNKSGQENENKEKSQSHRMIQNNNSKASKLQKKHSHTQRQMNDKKQDYSSNLKNQVKSKKNFTDSNENLVRKSRDKNLKTANNKKSKQKTDTKNQNELLWKISKSMETNKGFNVPNELLRKQEIDFKKNDSDSQKPKDTYASRRKNIVKANIEKIKVKKNEQGVTVRNKSLKKKIKTPVTTKFRSNSDDSVRNNARGNYGIKVESEEYNLDNPVYYVGYNSNQGRYASKSPKISKTPKTTSKSPVDIPKNQNPKPKKKLPENKSAQYIHLYEKNKMINTMRRDIAKQIKDNEEQEKLKECTFKPQKIAKGQIKTQLSFEQRQETWMNKKRNKLEIQRRGNEIQEIAGCTFEPEILSPTTKQNFDYTFYDRQLQWQNDLKDKKEVNKDIIFQKTHQQIPTTFISPFIAKSEIKESFLKNYIYSESPKMEDTKNYFENHNSHSDHSKNNSNNAIVHTTNSGSNNIQEFQNQEIVDAQNIFNTLNMIFDAKNQEINIEI